jgi:ABC-type glutathione transport system ATPase component
MYTNEPDERSTPQSSNLHQVYSQEHRVVDSHETLVPNSPYAEKSTETLALAHPIATTTAAPPKNTTWHLLDQVAHNRDRHRAAGYKPRELGVTWQNLSVEVPTADASVNENLFSQFNIPQVAQDYFRKQPRRSILSDSHGCVKPGEMLLVLGRPGSGCTTLLKLLSNRRTGYQSIRGDVFFGSMGHQEAAKHRGQIVMNTEEELFYPHLQVGNTMDFATKLKVPSHLPDGVNSVDEYVRETKNFLLESMGISHTAQTKVGNEFVRGVSGGERKRTFDPPQWFSPYANLL